jgi:hypothetical protein
LVYSCELRGRRSAVHSWLNIFPKKIQKSSFFVSGKQNFFLGSIKVGVMQTNCICRAATFHPNADPHRFLVLTAENGRTSAWPQISGFPLSRFPAFRFCSSELAVTHINEFFRDLTHFFKKHEVSLLKGFQPQMNADKHRFGAQVSRPGALVAILKRAGSETGAPMFTASFRIRSLRGRRSATHGTH